jgi:hypothetical protein
MRRLIALCAVWFSFGAIAVAQQEFPQGEFFLGYSHEIADMSRSKTGFDGFHLALAENVNSWFGGVLDFSTHFKNVSGTFVDTENVAFGPQFSCRKLPHVTPSAHAEVGVTHGSEGFLGNSTSGTHFALIVGGALDYKVGESVAIRPIQADWIHTSFQSLGRDNLRLSAGVVFRFGWPR